jgi:catechol 2,3-dioxygenase-like lactoylglutathione lyase family enzyme
VKTKGVNHVGVTVPNLEATVAWYREMFEIEPVFYIEGSGPEVDAAVEVAGAEIHAAYFLFGNVGVEFLEYRQPEGRAFDLRNCDIGAAHICFEVDDIQAIYERLGAKGVHFNSPPAADDDEDSPLRGTKYAYFRDLHGLQLELFQVPLDTPTHSS